MYSPILYIRRSLVIFRIEKIKTLRHRSATRLVLRCPALETSSPWMEGTWPLCKAGVVNICILSTEFCKFLQLLLSFADMDKSWFKSIAAAHLPKKKPLL
ncbi:hypothetical protein I7I50_07102 [Histoplasma capsulatum G186AR]|uniref:Uncharacterized protein n=1 Tax=Ajellomyces capsulatus TaxID=5037 RepID=A0A8H7YWZ3_AJECA|nr:hypothetical protein I7I52_09855 [Histoplasma capsulatum]QSS67892.1 hypothetical protein I7I50_07102 [Histoplasma capsulatum G186AR]